MGKDDRALLIESRNMAQEAKVQAMQAAQRADAASQNAARAAAAAEAAQELPEDPALFEALRTWRYGLAQELHVAPFIIAHDKTLKVVSGAKPTSLDDLKKLHGFGPKKIEQCGDGILEVVKNYLAKSPPEPPADDTPR